MPRLNIFIRRCTAVLAGLLISSATIALEPLPSDAQQTVDSYLAALQTGDTSTLASLLDGRMKARHERAMRNPGYAAHLMDSFGDMQFDVLGGSTEEGLLTADYLSRNDSETIRKRLYLQRTLAGYSIVAETVVP
jgi:hypothetical protein